MNDGKNYMGHIILISIPVQSFIKIYYIRYFDLCFFSFANGSKHSAPRYASPLSMWGWRNSSMELALEVH